MRLFRYCLALVALVVAASSVSGTEYGRFAVLEATSTPNPEALAMMVEVTPEVSRELGSVNVEWPAAGADGARVSLTVSPYASFGVHGTVETILVNVTGTVTGPTGRCRFEQAHFGQYTARAVHNTERSSLSLFLPVRFELAEGTSVHVLMLVPCSLTGGSLRCQPPRLAFSELVERFFPGQVSPAAVVPGVRSPGQDDSGALEDARWHGQHCCFGPLQRPCECVAACGAEECPGGCTVCIPNECINCEEIECLGC